MPADGVLIAGHSLAIDESSMTGESKIVSHLYLLLLYILSKPCYSYTWHLLQVHKDHKAPFLMSGCKVADGVGAMLVNILQFSFA